MLRRTCLLAGVVLFGTAGISLAQSRHTRDDAVRLVQRAAAFLQNNPQSVAFATFDDPGGPFRDGDLYVYVLDATDANLTMLAHGANKGLIGMPQRDIVDAEGKDFNKDTLAIIKAQGQGWVTYKWSNPVTRKIVSKRSFVQRVNNVIIGAGVYD